MTRPGTSAIVGAGVTWLAITALALNASVARTVRDGVYTEAQATRGRTQYMQDCAPCHLEDLHGFSTAPGLVGASFWSERDYVSVGEMLVRTRRLMPTDRPNGLSNKTYLDILAFILQSNAYPPGDKELEGDLESLEQILIPQATPAPTRR